MPLALKVGLIATGLGVVGVVAAPLVTEKADTWPFISSAMIGAGGLLLNKGNMKKSAPYLLVAGTAAGVTALSRTSAVRKAQAKADEIGPITKAIASRVGEGEEDRSIQ